MDTVSAEGGRNCVDLSSLNEGKFDDDDVDDDDDDDDDEEEEEEEDLAIPTYYMSRVGLLFNPNGKLHIFM